jgi:hypothetical protein
MFKVKIETILTSFLSGFVEHHGFGFVNGVMRAGLSARAFGFPPARSENESHHARANDKRGNAL